MRSSVKIFLIIVTAISLGQGRIRTVDVSGGGEYTTIHAAVSAAVSGDTIMVSSGTYDFSGTTSLITVSTKLFIIGSGYDPVSDGGTSLYDWAGNGFFQFDGNSDGSVLKGFRMESSGTSIQTQSGAKRITIEQNFIIENNVQAWALSFVGSQDDTLRQNIVVAGRQGITMNGCSNTMITNNLIKADSFYGGFSTSITLANETNITIGNNIIIGGGSAGHYYGTINGTSTGFFYSNVFINTETRVNVSNGPAITNNAFFNCGDSYSSGIQYINDADGAGLTSFLENFSASDAYTKDSFDSDDFNFHLAENSSGINAGRDGVTYYDKDATRNDMGMYGGPWPFSDDFGIPTIPNVIEISVDPATVSPTGTITITAKGRIGTGN